MENSGSWKCGTRKVPDMPLDPKYLFYNSECLEEFKNTSLLTFTKMS